MGSSITILSSIMSAFLVILTAAASSALPQYPLPFNTLPHFPQNIPQQFPGFQFPQPVLPPWFNPSQMFLDEASLPAWLKPQEKNEKENNYVVESDEASDNALSSDDNADSADDNADSADDNADSADDNTDSADDNADSADENADSVDDNADAAEVAETARFIDNTEAATTEGEGESATAVKNANEEYLKHRPSRPSSSYIATGGYSGSYNRPTGYTTGYTGYSAYPSGYPSYTSGSSGYSGSLTYPSSGSSGFSGSLTYPSSGSSGYSGSLTYPSSGYTGVSSYPTGYTGGSTYTSYPGYSGSSGFGGNTGYFTNTNGGYYGY